MKFILFLFDGMKWKRRWIVNAAPSYIRCAHEFRVVGYVFPAQLFTQLLFSLHSILNQLINKRMNVFVFMNSIKRGMEGVLCAVRPRPNPITNCPLIQFKELIWRAGPREHNNTIPFLNSQSHQRLLHLSSFFVKEEKKRLDCWWDGVEWMKE